MVLHVLEPNILEDPLGKPMQGWPVCNESVGPTRSKAII